MPDTPDELSRDPEWLALLSGFRAHFWSERVPAFQRCWSHARLLEPLHWPLELKRSLHGLAGVAALVDLPELGNEARLIEQQWDNGDSRVLLTQRLQALSDQLAGLSPSL